MENWRNYVSEANESSPKVIFMAGAPGAGKSTVIKRLGLENIEVINPDEFYEPALEKAGLGKNIKKIKADYLEARDKLKEVLKDILDLEEPEDGWGHDVLEQMFNDALDQVGEERTAIYNLESIKDQYDQERSKIVSQGALFAQAQKDAKEKQSTIADEGKDFIIDGTGGHFARIRNQANQLREAGYDTAMIFVDIPLETAIERQELRGHEGGRSLDPKAIEKSWAAVNRNIEPYRELFENTFFHIIATNEEMDGSIEQVKPELDAFLSQMSESFQSELKPRLHKQMNRLLRHGDNKTKAKPFAKKAPIDYRGSAPPGASGG